MKNSRLQITRISIGVLASLLFAAIANSQTTPTPTGRMWWTNGTSTSIAVTDRATGAELANFNLLGNVGGTCTVGEAAYAVVKGIAFDPTDGNLWVTFDTSGRCGDDVIHKIPAMGGPDIATIPNPAATQFNNTSEALSRSIGALDYDPEENVLYAVTYHASYARRVYKLDPKSGAIINQFDFPFATYLNTTVDLAIVHPPPFGGRKMLMVYQYYLDINTGAVLASGIASPNYGLDEDEVTGQIVTAGGWNADLSLEDGHRCDCKVIARPPTQPVSSQWPETDLNWSMTVEVSDNDGLVLHDVRLGQRYMAEKISVPYYTLQTSAFSMPRAELKPDGGSDPSASSRLIDYQVFKDDQKLIIQATYLIDKIPSTSKSCLHITQRYEFYKRVPGDQCEPSGTLPCARWKPIVSYKFVGPPGELISINVAQRQHRTVDQNSYNSVGLFRDPDSRPDVALGVLSGLGFASKCNPVPHEWSGQIVANGKDAQAWDNIHQTYKGKVDEPTLSWYSFDQHKWFFVNPGCPECIHSHWRWGAITGGEGNGNLIGIPPGSTQNVDFAVVRYHQGEEDPADYHGLLTSPEPIRTWNPVGRDPLQISWGRAPEDVVYWQSGTGRQSEDSFFAYGGFFNPLLPSQQLYSASGNGQDGITLISAAQTYATGDTTIAPFDASLGGALPAGYSQYSNLSYEVTTTAEASGAYTATLSVPSVTDQAIFNSLRVFHLEQDPYAPDGVNWVDRTILAPDPQQPDFTGKTLNARANSLGHFVVASLTQPQPPNTGVSDIGVSTSSPSTVVVGNNLAYTITITNSGPEPATGVVLSNALSPNVNFVSASPTQGNCAEVEGTVVCKLDTISAGASATLNIVAKPTESKVTLPAEGITILNIASAKANESDSNTNNNSSTQSTTVLPDGNAAPAVSITSPTVGAPFVGPANINVSATASDSDGSVSKVDFYGDGDLIGTGTATPPDQYNVAWNNVSFGSHSLIAVATDNLNKTRTSDPVTVIVNGSATVSITSPTSSAAAFNRPANITVIANASLSGGSISKVDFYANEFLIGTGSVIGVDQYGVTWNNAPAGKYALTAIATDGSGVATVSSLVNITVNDYPEVSLTSPAGGQMYTAPASIDLTASASDIDGTIGHVTFYANGSPICSRATLGALQYICTWANVSAGSYTLTAIATDNSGASTTSNPVNVTVNAPPTVSLTGPASGAQYVAPANIVITSTASDSDGSISRVDFFADGSSIGIGTVTGPNQYSLTWTNAVAGNHTLTAVATDNRGATTTSNSTSINVLSPALFVVGSTTLTSSDSVIKTRLEALSFVVTVKDGTAASTADATGKALVVISSTVTPTSVGTKFRSVAVPVVTWESGLFTNMGMTGSTNKDFGTVTKQTQVNIINPSHPMADGMMGQVGVTSTSGTLSWGKPNANAVSIATIVGDTSKIVIFGYEQGAAMPGLVAPARRVGLFMYDTTAASFYTPGQRLFDAAIRWAAGR